MDRHIGPFALMATGLGSIIGSGWLFGSWRAANIAGPAAIWSWVIGAIIILIIALSYAELGAKFPDSGAMVRVGRYSHGSLVGFIAAWANWIAIVSVIPAEAVASTTYLSGWPYWGHQWFRHLATEHNTMTPYGMLVCVILVMVYFFLNYYGVRLFARVNSLITIFKFIVPTLAVVGLMWAHFDTGNFHMAEHVVAGSTHADGTPIISGGFLPYGWSAVFTAVATSGIVFAFNGFQSPINMAGEAKNPTKTVPFAVIFSILLALVLYMFLQSSYIGALNPEEMAKGWGNIMFPSPFADLALSWGLNWIAFLLYFDAFVSPSGTGSIYTATTARMIYAMERNKTMPPIFGNVHPLYKVPRNAMYLNLVVSFLFLFWLRGWGSLAAVISVATVISYLTGPMSLIGLKRAVPDLKWPIEIWGMKVWAPIGFVFSSLLLYWAKWPLTGEIILLMVVALPLFFYYLAKHGWQNWEKDRKAAWWLVGYLPAMAVLSWIGSKQFGGHNYIPYPWDMLVVAIIAFIFFEWGVRSSYRTPYLDESKEEADEVMKGASH